MRNIRKSFFVLLLFLFVLCFFIAFTTSSALLHERRKIKEKAPAWVTGALLFLFLFQQNVRNFPDNGVSIRALFDFVKLSEPVKDDQQPNGVLTEVNDGVISRAALRADTHCNQLFHRR